MNTTSIAALYWPPDCRICATFASLVGRELLRANRILHRTFVTDCACGLTYGAHGAAHPHAAAWVGCAGIHAYTVQGRGEPQSPEETPRGAN